MKDRQTRDELTGWRPAGPGRLPKRFWQGWILALALTGLLVGLATLPPFVSPRLRVVLMQGFSAVCHQIPARSPHIDGVALAVCHRCYGIYGGLPLAVLGFLAVVPWTAKLGRYAWFIVPLSLMPLGLDWSLDVLNLWHNTPTSRLLTGGLFGLVAGLYVARALANAFAQASSGPSAQEALSGSSA